MSQGAHYRAISVTGLPPSSNNLSRRSSLANSDALPLKPTSSQDLPIDFLSRRPHFPRNYRWLRISAYAGWAVAAILSLTLLLNHPRIAPTVSSLDLGRFGGLRLDTVVTVGDRAAGLRGKVDAELTGMVPSAKELKAAVASKGVKLLPSSGLQAPVSIVSSFYRVDNGKKHRVSEYHEWLTNFLHSVELPIIFYCAPSMAAYIKNLRGNKPLTLVTNYTSPFEMPPLQNLGGHAWAEAQHKIDPEKHVHVPDVYGVWTAKPWIVKNAADLDPYGSEYFFWVDAGGFRDSSITHSFNKLPSVLDSLYSSLPSDTVVLAATTVPFEAGTSWVREARPNDVMDREDRLQGGWFGGKKEGVELWEKETMKVTVMQSAMMRFAAKEQPVWTMAARLNWKNIYVQNMAWAQGPECGSDMWFRFEDFADGRDCQVPAWNGPEYALLDAAEQQQKKDDRILASTLDDGGDQVGREGFVQVARRR